LSEPVKKVAVIGAGMVGVSTAIWLQRSGHEVILIDREGVAAGASYGNAGILACSGIIPVTTPGLIFKAPRMLLDPDQPLFLRWSYLPKILPWLVKFLKKANTKDMNHIVSKLHHIMYDSVDQHMALAKDTAAEKFIKPYSYVHGFTDKAHYTKDEKYFNILRQHGYELIEMQPDEIAEFDPALKGKFGYAIRSTSDGKITDPGAYIHALADDFKSKGGEVAIGEVSEIFLKDNKATGIRFVDGKVMYADQIVISSGAWSAKLTNKLGLNIPLETERGYHLEFVNPNIELKSPVMVTTGKFGMNSMEGRLRCAGIVELGGLDAEPSRAPFELLKRQVHALFPELEYDEVSEWMGHRPSTPDSLPLIGAFGNTPNVWAGFGHQHLGLTGGPKTGRWIAQMISGEKINEDLTAYSPDRF
jgi:D-amino-acid dehydrogenase